MKKIYHILMMSLVMMIGLSTIILPTKTSEINAADGGLIYEMSGLSNYLDVATYGQSVSLADMKLKEKAVYHAPERSYYQVMRNGEFELSDDIFTAGSWRYVAQIRVDESQLDNYRLSNSVTLNINGESWKRIYGDVRNGTNYCYVYFVSPTFTVEAPTQLNILKSNKLQLHGLMVNQYFRPFDLKPFTSGGQGPYVYEKIAGPEWVKVSNDGVLSGIVSDEEETLVVRATDQRGESAYLETFVGNQQEERVIEVNTWGDFKAAFSNKRNQTFNIRLMSNLQANARDTMRSDTSVVEVHNYGNDVTIDFNGYTLSCFDNVSITDTEYQLMDFLRIVMHPKDDTEGSVLRLMDSKGNGGIKMDSYRAIDGNLAALHIKSNDKYYESLYGDSMGSNGDCVNKVVIDGGNYRLSAETDKFSNGTLSNQVWYRGSVIASHMITEVNDGYFEAKGSGVEFGDMNMTARELSAFATCTNETYNSSGIVRNRTFINGGTFVSNGYAIHHFDSAVTLDTTNFMDFPTIRGGIFSGHIGYVGMTFDYSDGCESFVNEPASTIIPGNVQVVGIDEDNQFYTSLEGITLSDLHKGKSLYILSNDLFKVEQTPYASSQTVNLNRNLGEKETFSFSYEIPEILANAVLEVEPFIIIQGKKSSITKQISAQSYEVDYGQYKNGVDIKMGAYLTIATQKTKIETHYDVNVVTTYEMKDSQDDHVRIVPVHSNYVTKGENYQFTIEPEEGYAIVDETLINITSTSGTISYADGIYTLENIQDHAEIEVFGNGIKGIAKVTISALGDDKVTVDAYTNDEIVLKTPQEYDFEVMEGYVFKGWKVDGNKVYQPNETYIVHRNGDIAITAVWDGLHHVTVVNGQAYRDEAFTQPLEYATKETRVYIKAEEKEGSRFDIWSVDNNNIDSFRSYVDMESSFEMPDEDVVVRATYQKIVSEIVVKGLDRVVAGDMLLTHDEQGNMIPKSLTPGVNMNYYRFLDSENNYIFGGEIFKRNAPYTIELSLWTSDEYIFDDLDNISLRIMNWNQEYTIENIQFSNSYHDTIKFTIKVSSSETYERLEKSIRYASLIRENECDEASYQNLLNEVEASKTVMESDDAQAVYNQTLKLEAALAQLTKLPGTPVVEISQVDYKTLRLSWYATSYADAYQIYRKTPTSDEFKLVSTISDTEAMMTVTTGKEYAYYVVAIKNEEESIVSSKPSNIVKGTTQLEGTPALSIEKVGNTKFKLNWNLIDGATRYIIYRKREGGSYKKVLTLGKDDFSYTTASMAAGTYYYMLRAGRYDSVDRVMTNKSNEVSGKSVFSKPVITLTAGSKQIKVSWKAVEGIKYYQVYRATSKSGKYTKLKTTTATSYTNQSLTSGKSYYYKVRGYKEYEGEKIYSSFSEIKTTKAK